MKYLMAFLLLLVLSSSAFAVVRWAPEQFIGDQQISSGSTIIYDATIYYQGVTAGDKLVLINSLTATGSGFMTFVAPAANGFQHIPYSEGILCDTGVYMDETKTGGVFGLNLLYQ